VLSLLYCSCLTGDDNVQEIVSTVTSKGQVTIPAEVRRHLGIGTHDKVAFILDDDGEVRLSRLRYPTIASLRGIAGSLPRSLSWQDVEEIAQDEQAEAVAKSL
jgi:antitoxin PrlF